jgi:hypothetical protein
MLIDKPQCNFQNCRYCFDGNCRSADKYENCQLTDLHYRIAKLTVDLDNAKTEGENISQMHPSDEFICEKCGLIIRECCRYEIDEDDGDEICYEFPYRFCPRCGMKVKGDKTDA